MLMLVIIIIITIIISSSSIVIIIIIIIIIVITYRCEDERDLYLCLQERNIGYAAPLDDNHNNSTTNDINTNDNSNKQ